MKESIKVKIDEPYFPHLSIFTIPSIYLYYHQSYFYLYLHPPDNPHSKYLVRWEFLDALEISLTRKSHPRHGNKHVVNKLRCKFTGGKKGLYCTVHTITWLCQMCLLSTMMQLCNHIGDWTSAIYYPSHILINNVQGTGWPHSLVCYSLLIQRTESATNKLARCCAE